MSLNKTKQINNLKYIPKKDGTITIVNQYDSKMTVPRKVGEEMFNNAYAAYKADKIFEEVVHKLGINIKSAHLLTSDDKIVVDGVVKQKYLAGTRRYSTDPKDIFLEQMEKALYSSDIDYSYVKTVSKKYGVNLSGNFYAWAWSYYGLLWQKPWTEFKVTHKELEDYLKEHKNIRIVEECHGLSNISRDKLLSITFGTESKSMGYGSQASVIETTVKLYKDEQGNLKVDRYSLVYD